MDLYSVWSAAARDQSLTERLGVLSGALRARGEAAPPREDPLAMVARTLTDFVGDGCLVHLLSDDGWLLPVAIELPLETIARDAEVLAAVRAIVFRPQPLTAHAEACRVTETGRAHLVTIVDRDATRAVASPELAAAFEAIGVHSVLFVALRVRGAAIGVLTLVRFSTDAPPYDDQDLATAQALADHAALASNNAGLLESVLCEHGSDPLHAVMFDYKKLVRDEVNPVERLAAAVRA